MVDEEIALNPNQIIRFLDKAPEEFTKRDLIKFIEENNIRMVKFRYVGGDGRLKTLNFVITSKSQLDRLFSIGERVDGSSLFSYVDAGSSDLYVIPRFKTAYVNPFSEIPAIDILCSFYTSEGKPLPSAPEQILYRAHEELKKSTGMTMEAMGELEYYAFYDANGTHELYPGVVRGGYHESTPFTKGEKMVIEAMQAIAQAGGKIKYGHSEVGCVSGEKTRMEQHEIEFLPVPVEDAADHLIIAKWMLRMIGYKYGVTVTFAPKILVGHAGSGLHFHTRLMKDGKNAMVEGERISDTARKVIAGYLTIASSLTAFGNTVPVSYLRLVPHQEAPTNICWGERNRSVLVRVPLGWLNVGDMVRNANPQEKSRIADDVNPQTVEYRGSDGSADVYLTLAALAVGARHGQELKNAIELTKSLYVSVNIFSPEHRELREKLAQLPRSCWESAEKLLKDRAIYEAQEVFPPRVIDEVVKKLKAYNDANLSEQLYGKEEETRRQVEKYIHCS